MKESNRRLESEREELESKLQLTRDQLNKIESREIKLAEEYKNLESKYAFIKDSKEKNAESLELIKEHNSRLEDMLKSSTDEITKVYRLNLFTGK